MKALILLLSVMLVSLPVANAEVYKWVDENGNVNFSDSPPPQQKTEEDTATEPSDRKICSKAIRNISRYAPAWERKIKAKMPEMSPEEREAAEQSLVQLRNNVQKVETGLNQCVADMEDASHRGKTECMANAQNDTMAMFCVM